MTKEIKIRNVPDHIFEQLHTISDKYNYSSFNEFMLSQCESVVMNDGLDLYENQFALSLSEIKIQQSQILNLLLKNEIKMLGYSAKQEIVEQLTVDWLSFIDDEKAVTSERQAGGDH